MAQVQVADEQSLASAPVGRQPLECNRGMAHVDAARDYQTPKASQQRRSGKRSANPGAEWSKAGFRNNRQQRVPHNHWRMRPEQKIEKASQAAAQV